MTIALPDHPTHVLLDLDGTLTDSAPGVMASLRVAFAETIGAVPDDDHLRGFVGPPLGLSFARSGLTHAQTEAAIEVYRREFENGGMLDNSVYDGVPALLTALREAGLTRVIATAKPQVYARQVVHHFGLDTDLTGGLDGVFGPAQEGAGNHEGKEKVIARALAASGGDQAGAVPVMIGDREHDVVAAAANGVPTIGVTWGYGGAGELETAGAATVVDSPEELRTLLTA